MTVEEMIQKLQQLPQNAIVGSDVKNDDYWKEDNWTPITSIEAQPDGSVKIA